ncbi:MAG: glutamyl-tRNA reductase [Candidatus Bathyarchaeota archaeon]|nr:glutamyl-tRNA reductase [Candidatus Bathyarchaeota archaeon]
MRPFATPLQLINVRLTHKTANVPLLEAASFKDRKQALVEFCGLRGVHECVLLQTCNRVELYLISEDGVTTAEAVKDTLIRKVGVLSSEISRAVEISLNEEALLHLLRVTAGLESMVIGEDQVITQVWDAYLEAENAKTAGPVFKHLFKRAVKIGRRVRKETGINKGAVSVGSAAVELAESLLGTFKEKKILVMGAGEMGTLVAKSLSKRCLNPIFIANRTYDRAVRLATELSGRAVKFDKLGEVVADADVIICSTSAPHYLLTKELMVQHVRCGQKGKHLIVIDISNPRNVEESVREIEGVTLYNIDDLSLITEKNKLKRQKNVEKAQKIIDEELAFLSQELKTETVREIIAKLLSRAEKARQRELEKALSMIGNVGEREKKIISDLTSILMKRTFVPLVENLRLAAKNNDIQTIEHAIKLFNVASDNQS